MNSLDKNGFEIVTGLLEPKERCELMTCLGPANGAGRRGVLGIPLVERMASSARIIALIRTRLKSEPRAVRGIYFDKSLKTNWIVAWHQDLALAVQARVDIPGFGPWSRKNGVPHVLAPAELLERMLILRLHLDDCDETNGALRVLPGTHLLGRLSASQIKSIVAGARPTTCCLSSGDALLMRPLLLHSSSRSRKPVHRRVLHIEYAAFDLPSGLGWYETI